MLLRVCLRGYSCVEVARVVSVVSALLALCLYFISATGIGV